MIGLGTLINCTGILLGGALGHFAGRLLKEEAQQSLKKTCGVSVLFIAIAGAMEGMLTVEDGSVIAGKSMFVVICLLAGTVIGELAGIERGLERFGEWLKMKSGNAKDTRFVDAFLTASLTVCVGAMAVVGAIEDGLAGDYTILAVKTVLDFILILVMTPSYGKGCTFSVIPVLILEGGLTLLARSLAPVLTDAAVFNLSFIGSILIFCVGINLIRDRTIRVANMLPAILLAVFAAYLPVPV